MSTRIVIRDAEGVVTRTFFDSSTNTEFRNGGYSGARKAFASKKFDPDTKLAAGETLVLLVGDAAKLTFPEPKKGGKRKAGTPSAAAKKGAKGKAEGTAEKKPKVDKADKADKVEEKPKSTTEEGWTPPADGAAAEEAPAPSPAKKTCTPSMLLSMPMKSGKPPRDLPPPLERPSPAPKKKRGGFRKKVVVESDSEESLAVQGVADADSEEELNFDEAEAESEEEDDGYAPAPPVEEGPPGANPARAWGAFSEREIEPEAGQALGDEWNDGIAGPCERPCRHVSVVKALGPADLARRFHAEGVLLLESAKWALARGALDTLKQAVAAHYADKLAEAQADGLTKGGKQKHVLKASETETLAGFNQRPGGRVDMVLDELDAVKSFDGEFPWAPVVRAVLGPKPSLNFVGCVVARPGDSTQNWHIDGVHAVLEEHARADRIIVFCPLTDLDEATGCTEFVPKSHFESRGARAKFPNVSHMRRARHYVHAGTPIVMDYRLWHRGLPNTSDKLRYLMYCVYQTPESKQALEDTGGDIGARSNGVKGERAW